MIFQPAIIALLLASLVSVALLVGVTPYAVEIIRFWDIRSGSERQLELERCTYLLSTLASFVFATQIVALLLFVFNADKMAAMIVGAMCAVGTLSVNSFGFPALISQIVLFFAAVCWLIINHVDTRSPDYPLVRTKYVLLLLLLPLLLVMAALQFRFFLGIKADVITSCCGSLFSEENPELSGAVASVPALPAMVGFYVALVLAILASLYYWRRGRRNAGCAQTHCPRLFQLGTAGRAGRLRRGQWPGRRPVGVVRPRFRQRQPPAQGRRRRPERTGAGFPRSVVADRRAAPPVRALA